MSSIVRHRKKRQRSPQTVIIPEINYSFYVKKFITEPGDLAKESFISRGTYKLVFRLKLDNYDRVLMFTFSSKNHDGTSVDTKCKGLELFFPVVSKKSIRCLDKVPQQMTQEHMDTLQSFGIYLPQRMHTEKITIKQENYLHKSRPQQSKRAERRPHKEQCADESADDLDIYVYVYDMPFLGYELPHSPQMRCPLDHVSNMLNNLFPNIVNLTYGVKKPFAYHVPDIKIENTVCDGRMVSPVDLEELIIWDKGNPKQPNYKTVDGVETPEYIQTYNYDINLTHYVNLEIQKRYDGKGFSDAYIVVDCKDYTTPAFVQGNINNLDFTRGSIVISFTLLKLFFDIVLFTLQDKRQWREYVNSLVHVLYEDETSLARTNFESMLTAIMQNNGSKAKIVHTNGSEVEIEPVTVPLHHCNSVVLLFILNNMCSPAEMTSLLCFQRPSMRDSTLLFNNIIILKNTLMHKIHKAFCAVYSSNAMGNAKGDTTGNAKGDTTGNAMGNATDVSLRF